MSGRTHRQRVIHSCCRLWPRGLLVAVEFVRGASGSDTYDSRVFFRQQRQSSKAQSRCQCAEADAITGQTTVRHGLTSPAGGWRETDRRRVGNRRIVTQCENFWFSDQDRKCEEPFVFGMGRKGSDWRGVATRARGKERADWALAMRRPR